MQVVYNANRLSELVNKKKKLQNWLDFYQLKYSRHPSRKPSLKVQHSNLWTLTSISTFGCLTGMKNKEITKIVCWLSFSLSRLVFLASGGKPWMQLIFTLPRSRDWKKKWVAFLNLCWLCLFKSLTYLSFLPFCKDSSKSYFVVTWLRNCLQVFNIIMCWKEFFPSTSYIWFLKLFLLMHSSHWQVYLIIWS